MRDLFENWFCGWKCIFRRSRSLIFRKFHFAVTIAIGSLSRILKTTDWNVWLIESPKYNIRRNFPNLEITIYTCVYMEREHYPENVAFLIRGIFESPSCDVCIFLKK